MFWTIIGSSAAVLTMFSFVPQVIRALKTRSMRDVSLLTLLQLSSGVFLWIIYGMHLRNAVIIVANAITLVSLIILLYLYFKFRRIS